MKLKYTLPDGRSTPVLKSYEREWREFTSPFCQLAGCDYIGEFNGGVILKYNNEFINLPVPIITKINELIQNEKEQRELAQGYSEEVQQIKRVLNKDSDY